MYAGRTSETVLMTTFENFYDELVELARKYEQSNLPLKIEKDLENNVVKIFGEKITSLARAKNGLNDVSELALATAEHHPFWNLLYNCSEISHTILDKWSSQFTKDEIDDIQWSIKELTQTLEKIKENQK